MKHVFACRCGFNELVERGSIRDKEIFLAHFGHGFTVFIPNSEEGRTQAIMGGVPYHIVNKYREESK
jgi:hypothetical protein